MFVYRDYFLKQSLCLPYLYGLNASNSIVAGSFSLFAHDVLKVGDDGCPGDIDIICLDQRLFQSKCLVFGAQHGDLNGYRGALVELKGGADSPVTVDMTAQWPVHGMDQGDILSRSVEKFGFRFMSPFDAYNCMVQFDRAKDKDRLAKVRDRLGFNWTSGFTQDFKRDFIVPHSLDDVYSLRTQATVCANAPHSELIIMRQVLSLAA